MFVNSVPILLHRFGFSLARCTYNSASTMSKVYSFIVRNSLFICRALSPLGRNFKYIVNRYNFRADLIFYENRSSVIMSYTSIFVVKNSRKYVHLLSCVSWRRYYCVTSCFRLILLTSRSIQLTCKVLLHKLAHNNFLSIIALVQAQICLVCHI